MLGKSVKLLGRGIGKKIICKGNLQSQTIPLLLSRNYIYILESEGQALHSFAV